MSTHPNVILMAVLTPDALSRKTMKAICADCGEDDIKIGENTYHHHVMESGYEEDYQISADEGDLVFFDFVTYGYGDTITWEKLQKQKDELEKWAQKTCGTHDCSFEIRVSANYW